MDEQNDSIWAGREGILYRKTLHSSAPKIAKVTRTSWLRPCTCTLESCAKTLPEDVTSRVSYECHSVFFLLWTESSAWNCIVWDLVQHPHRQYAGWFCSSIMNSILYMILHKQQMSQKLCGLKRNINSSPSWCFCSGHLKTPSELADFPFIFLYFLPVLPSMSYQPLS